MIWWSVFLTQKKTGNPGEPGSGSRTMPGNPDSPLSGQRFFLRYLRQYCFIFAVMMVLSVSVHPALFRKYDK
jgi:hypothetical protein